MIPLARRRAPKGFERTLLSYSRQSLPRPARFSTSWRKQLAALATAPTQRPDDRDLHVRSANHRDTGPHSDAPEHSEMGTFLQRQTPYTILPTPVPSDVQDPVNEFIFPSTPVQDSLSVIDACLHNCYDVKRAQYVFDQLRSSSAGDAVLQARVYNLFFEAYLDMARAQVQQGDLGEPVKWLKQSWSLFQSMEDGGEKAVPNAGTYAIMLKTWLRYGCVSFGGL